MSRASRLVEYIMDRKKYTLLTSNEVNHATVENSPEAKDDHIFEVDELGKIKKSCCGQFELRDNMREFIDYIAPMKASRMRRKVANLGRCVCGRCVASLYGNRDTKQQDNQH